MASVQTYMDSLKTHSQLIPKTLTTNGWLVRGVPRCSDTKRPLTGTSPPPDIPLAQTRLSPPLFPHSPPTRPCPPLSFHSTTIVPSFSGILISPKTNGSRIFLSLLLLASSFLLFSLPLSLLHSVPMKGRHWAGSGIPKPQASAPVCLAIQHCWEPLV